MHVGSRVGTADGSIIDAAGKLYARGTTTCLIFPM
jgi:acyl-coenzyme A thioesterase PaaI-like protein